MARFWRRPPRLLIALAVAALAALAVSWHFATRDETGEPEKVRSAVVFDLQGGDGEVALDERGPASRVKTFSGLQTTVPDTLGYVERTAVFALEEGGFRVRVMNRKVSDPRQEGIVVQQLPRGGVTRRLNWIVTIVVGIIK